MTKLGRFIEDLKVWLSAALMKIHVWMDLKTQLVKLVTNEIYFKDIN